MSDEEKIAFIASDEDKLSPEEKLLQAEVRQTILARAAETDKNTQVLESALSEAKSVLNAERVSKLDAAQRQWERQGRGKDINALVQSGVPAADAYGAAIKKRAEWVNLRSSWAMLIDMPGLFGGFYRAEQDRTVEIYDMGDKKLNLVLRYKESEFVFTATGIEDGNKASLKSEFDVMASVELIRTESDGVKIELGADFSRSSLGKMGTLIEGIYQRVKPGELDVFAQ